MNPETNLILVKSKRKPFQEKTEDIQFCHQTEDKCIIVYTSWPKEYPYNKSNVIWRKDPFVQSAESLRFKYDGNHLRNVGKLYDFDDYFRIQYSSGKGSFFGDKSKLEIFESALENEKASDVFQYLKQLSQITGTSLKGETETLLFKQYNSISFVDERSSLAALLNPAKFRRESKSCPAPVFPFGFNLSQKQATIKALESQISLIEGPPGTGKTQTILNIIANAVMQGKTVAVVSNNNSATANVYEKLQKYGVDFIAAFLGRKDNKEQFFNNQDDYPEVLNSWGLPTNEAEQLKTVAIETAIKIEDLLVAQNELAECRQQLDALDTEQKYFKDYQASNVRIPPYKASKKHSSQTIAEIWTNLQSLFEKENKPGIWYKLFNLFKYGIYSFSFYRNDPDAIITFLQEQFYILKRQELNLKAASLVEKIDAFNFDDVIQSNRDDAQTLFKAYLAGRFKSGSRLSFSIKTAMSKKFDKFIAEYPVILSTTHSLRSCTDKQRLFDYVIMDEASQIDLVSGALALSCAKQAVIVGDLKQLPNVVTRKIQEKTDRLFQESNLDHAYDYARNSLLSCMATLFSEVPKTLLREHYRCHPKIIEFCNQKFYKGQLITLTQGNKVEVPLAIHKTAKGNHARGKINQRQIDVIKEEILPDFQGQDDAIGIVSPYCDQVKGIDDQLDSEEIMVNTVHKYQGREKDIIILSTVVNEINAFVDNPNLLNVAVSRAVKQLMVVISDNEKNKNTNIGDLIRYVEYNNFKIVKSRLYSIFDLLYKHNADKLTAFKKGRKKVSEYESENLMYALITNVLAQDAYQFLGVVVHVPLKMVLRNHNYLDHEEFKFAISSWTHLDFIIYNKMDKSVVLTVEVDGYAFHADNPVQLKRDQLKDRILDKYGIPLIRFATTGSQEEQRLVAKLNAILEN